MCAVVKAAVREVLANATPVVEHVDAVRLAPNAARMQAPSTWPMALDLYTAPGKIGMPTYLAWSAKEDFMDLLVLAHTHPGPPRSAGV